MKNFTTEERQEIYEHLLTLQCPDLLAALIAERVDVIYIFDMGCNVIKHEIQSWIVDGFDWFLTPEEHDFWHNMHDCVCEFEDSTQGEEEDYSDHGGGSILADYIPPTLVEAIDNTTFEMYNRHTQDPLSFWARVKLFLGRWIYKV